MSDLIEDLKQADAAYRQADEAVTAIGEEELQQLDDIVEEFQTLLNTYVETATGSGREVFQEYVDFQGELATFENRLPESIPEHETFTEAVDFLDQRRLSEPDFERARAIISPAVDLTNRLDERHQALEHYRDIRHKVSESIRDLDRQLSELDRILEYESLDLDASGQELRDPIETYNSGIHDAFTTFKQSTSSHTVLAFIDTTQAYPLVSFQLPPKSLTAYLSANPAGNEPIPTLLEWTGYTRPKLAHYVEDPGRFQAQVGANRTYLDRLSADPLTIDWPPPPAAELRWRADELVRVVDRIAPSDVVQAVHEIRTLTRQPNFDDLRKTAMAETELTAEQKSSLQTGEIHDQRASLQDQRDQLADALATYPER